ncbi:sterol desaturase family protein [Blastomonas fulva]|uniref:sterol desaturase family protein n=1 Tax=Blastomonas fulva TaxID=1550728 RepID=UPI003F72478E
MIASGQPWLISGVLIGTALALMLAEAVWPRRRHRMPLLQRWRTHLGFVLVNMPIERGVQALVFIGVFGAVTGYALHPDFGLLPQTGLPFWAQGLIAILLLDLAVWTQHWATHRLPLLWRLHRVHHADRDLDMSTALRFHPLEIGLSMLFKLGVALALGAPLWALIVFELLLAVLPMFNHANLALPLWLDSMLRLVIVTPDMHRVHHSTRRVEHDSNYGFCLSIWDRLFRTYRARPSGGHEAMTIGLADYPGRESMRFGWSMGLPFR